MKAQLAEIKTWKNVCILAGNSRLDVNEDQSIKVESQLHAFSAGLTFADLLRQERGELPSVSIGFDHKGTFRKHFLADGLSRSQKRYPRLSNLCNDVTAVYEQAAREVNVPLEHIMVIPEDSARTRMTNQLEKIELPPEIRNRLVVAIAPPQDETPNACTIGDVTRTKINCNAMTVEYFRRAAHEKEGLGGSDTLLEIFFEDDLWSRVNAWMRGLQLTHILGESFAMRLNLVDASGAVRPGQIVRQKQASPINLLSL